MFDSNHEWMMNSWIIFIILISFYSTKQIWYSSIDWFIEVWWLLKMDDYWYNEDKGWWNGEFEMVYECINLNMNGMVINSSTNEKNDSMNWWILYSNDVIWNIIDWLLWYIVTYYQYDMFNEWIMTFIFEYVNLLSEKRAQSMTIM